MVERAGSSHSRSAPSTRCQAKHFSAPQMLVVAFLAAKLAGLGSMRFLSIPDGRSSACLENLRDKRDAFIMPDKTCFEFEFLRTWEFSGFSDLPRRFQTEARGSEDLARIVIHNCITHGSRRGGVRGEMCVGRLDYFVNNRYEVRCARENLRFICASPCVGPLQQFRAVGPPRPEVPHMN